MSSKKSLSKLFQRCTVGSAAQFCQVRHRQRSNRKRPWTHGIKNENPSLDWAKKIYEMHESGHQESSDDTPKEPHMLHVVCRMKPIKGQRKTLQEIMEKLGLDGKKQKFVVLKNEPSVNEQLKQVKHLIRIMPLRFPHGLPEHESDYENSYINSRGEFIVRKRIEGIEPVLLEPNPEVDKWRLDPETVEKELKRKKDNFAVNTEYFKTKHVYKRNEDGNEYRYTHNLRD